MSKVKILVDDPHQNPDFRRYKSGDIAKVIEYKSRLSAGRSWHYKVELEGPRQSACGKGLSRIVYFTKQQVKPV